jgi:hypothetical protein
MHAQNLAGQQSSFRSTASSLTRLSLARDITCVKDRRASVTLHLPVQSRSDPVPLPFPRVPFRPDRPST